ncbi:MAG: S8 family peptidase [Hydrogenophaga sp.]|nr:S8 family peptidase [Hydrogenophaga sp.]
MTASTTRRTAARSCSLAATALACALLGLAPAHAQSGSAARPTVVGKPIAGQYIVTLRPTVTDVDAQARRLTQGAGGSLNHVYQHALKGFSAKLPAAAIEALRNNPAVLRIDQDAAIHLNATQNSAPWGLDRIDQVDRPLSSTYDYTTTGAGVRAYVIDTGIRSSHVDFGGRVLSGYTAINDGRGTDDCNGHGTHVAGTVGGGTWGVAKAVQLVPVRVLDCTGAGSYSGVIAGIDWVAAQTHRPAVANLSLGGPASATLDAAVAGAIGKGISMVVAAGNDNANACNYSPARAPDAITVGATTSSDARASYSNFGTCLDLFAPGSSVKSAWSTGDTATNTLNGTSMAAPHAAGVVALMLEAKPDASPLAIAEHLKTTASVNKLSSTGAGSPNRLLYSLSNLQAADMKPVNVAVSGLTGRSLVSKTNWRAEATVIVRNLDTGAAVPNASISVEFKPGGTASCTTGSSGSCAVTSAALKNTVGSTDALVLSISGTNLVHDATQNSATSLRISK